MAGDGEPEWLTLYRARAATEKVAAAWLEGLTGDERQRATDDPPAARAGLRRLIVDSECPEVRADAANGWKYTGSVLRAADAALGIPPPKPRWELPGTGTGPQAASRPAPGGVAVRGSGGVERKGFRPRLVVEGDGSPGSLGLWWSDYETAKQARALHEQCKITHRLNLAVECVGKLGPEEGGTGDESAVLPTEHIPMADQFDPDSDLCEEWPRQLEQLLEKLRELRDRGAVVNVNCQMGKNRSGAAFVLWLCCELGWTMDAAVERLRAITPLACGNPHLLAAVAQLLKTTVQVPLNPAPNGGGWVCISPPGSPREGATAAFEQQATEAFRRLAAMQPEAAAEQEEEEDQAPFEVAAEGDMGALFDDLSDVDD